MDFHRLLVYSLVFLIQATCKSNTLLNESVNATISSLSHGVINSETIQSATILDEEMESLNFIYGDDIFLKELPECNLLMISISKSIVPSSLPLVLAHWKDKLVLEVCGILRS